MIDLYYWTTPNGHKISIMLEEAKLAYRVKPVNIGRGEQFNKVRSSLEDAGYLVHWRILCPKDMGVPMHRRRLCIVAIRKDVQKHLAA